MNKYKLYNWKILDKEVVHMHLYNYCIVISNRTDNAIEFYTCFNSILNIYEVNKININNTLLNKVIYLRESFEENSNIDSVTYNYIYMVLYQKSIDFIKNKICLKNKFNCLFINNVNNIRIIQEFDQGNEIVNIVNSKGEFLYYIEKKDFFQNKFELNILRKQQIYVNKKENNDDFLTEQVADYILKTKLKEIPILVNKYINAVATTKNIAKIELQWNLINQTDVLEYFSNYKKIIISSECGLLKKFYLRYHCMLNIEILTDKSLKNILDGEYDLIIMNSDGWDTIDIKSISINQIYLDLLSKTLYKKMKEKKIEYFYFSRPIESKVKNVSKRWATHDGSIVFPESIFKNGYYQVKDFSSDFCNTMNGIRLTLDSPKNYNNTIWFFGPCIVAGLNVSDEDTMESKLQKILNDNGLCYRIINCGQHGLGEGRITDINILYKMIDMKYKEGDIILHFGSNTWNSGYINRTTYYYDLSDFFNENDEKYFVNGWTSHLDKNGYNILTNYIYELINPIIKKSKIINKNLSSINLIENNYVDENMRRVWNEYYSKVLYMLPNDLFERKVGCIVMNGNPFTNGHAYLIQEAIRQVEYLIVFVVEEDKSFFSFNDRFNMFKMYCDKFPNIFVVPSGKCIISTETFGEYFNKELLQNETVTPIKDAQIFAEIIAPQLNISIRFVGDEPIDLLTRQYNKTLETVLPSFGIILKEIKRYEVNGEVVSASKVRLMLKHNDFDKIKQYVPQTTLDYLLKLRT